MLTLWLSSNVPSLCPLRCRKILHSRDALQLSLPPLLLPLPETNGTHFPPAGPGGSAPPLEELELGLEALVGETGRPTDGSRSRSAEPR